MRRVFLCLLRFRHAVDDHRMQGRTAGGIHYSRTCKRCNLQAFSTDFPRTFHAFKNCLCMHYIQFECTSKSRQTYNTQACAPSRAHTGAEAALAFFSPPPALLENFPLFKTTHPQAFSSAS